ncbi:hypothetical protein F5051DRAFT_410819, partial [Lentinula edodes]
MVNPGRSGHANTSNNHSYKRRNENIGQKPTNGKTPKLSDAKRAEYDSEGRCYKCSQPGHFSRNCPQNNIVRSGSSGPPGISARAMQFPLRDENSEMLAQLAEITEP